MGPIGAWRELRRDWARPTDVACHLCGRPLFGRVWTAEVQGAATDFCTPACEALFHAYWLPRHGPASDGER